MKDIDPSKVELACDHDGCALIPDDGNPHNDITPPGGNKNQGNHGSNQHQHYGPYEPEINNNSSHGIELPLTGHRDNAAPGTDAEIAEAAYDENNAVIVHDGEAFLAPIDSINPDAVELACNEEGCALIKDDGNPANDITPPVNHADHANNGGNGGHNGNWTSQGGYQ